MRNLLAVLLFCLASCSQQSWISHLASPQEQALATKVADLLRAGQTDALSRLVGPQIRPQLPHYIKTAKPLLLAVHGRFRLMAVTTVKSNSFPATKTFLVQAGSGGHWAVVSVAFQRLGTATRIVGLNISPSVTDPSKMDDFSISSRGMTGYVFLSIMLACVTTCLWAVFLIWRTRWLERRWLWTLGSLFGFVGLGLNWSNGIGAILFMNVSLLGAGATKAGVYAPWILSFGVPVIAILVIVRWYRRERDTDELRGIASAR